MRDARIRTLTRKYTHRRASTHRPRRIQLDLFKNTLSPSALARMIDVLAKALTLLLIYPTVTDRDVFDARILYS